MDETVVYRAHVRVERLNHSALRRAYLPAESQPVFFGTHDEVARFYGLDPAAVEPHATTLDYVIAAAAS
jgi:hypothetical protein